MNCPNCNKQIEDKDTICPHCKADLQDYMGTGDLADMAAQTPTNIDTEALAKIQKTWKSVTGSENLTQTIKESVQTVKAPSRIHITEKTITSKDQVQPETPPDYEIIQKIGEGGMGVIYTARQSSVDRIVALKMVKGSEEDKQKNLFLSEAVATGSLDHPNIVPIHELGSNTQGQLFYSMKKVQGAAWNRMIRQKSRQENLEILMRVCDAVAFAHSRGVIHRDLKPENIMLGDFGEVYVMDWGLAASVSADGKAQPLNANTASGGTPAYMAPEMGLGSIDKIGKHSDVYLLGAILYEIITDTPPHTGSNMYNCIYNVIHNKIEEAEEKGELVDIALTAMAAEPEDRYESVKVFQEAIREYESHAESIIMTVRAEEKLEAALKEKDYSDFARAVFMYEDALALWEDNQKALEGGKKASIAYAFCAFEKHDYDLAYEILETHDLLETELAQKVEKAKRARDIRQKRIRKLTYAAAVLGVTVVIVITTAFFLVRSEYRKRFALQEKKREGDITLAITAKLQSAEMTQEYLASMDTLVDRLKAVAPEKAEGLRAQLNERFSSCIKESLRDPRLSKQEIADIESAIRILSSRLPAEAVSLSKQLKERKQDYVTDFELKHPFDNLDAVFEPDQVLADKKTGTAKPSSLKNVIYTRFRCRGHTQLAGTFRFPDRECSMGLVLNGYKERGYYFKLSITPPKENKRAGACMYIMRDRTILRKKEIAGGVTGKRVKLYAERKDSRFIYTLNNKTTVEYEDVFFKIGSNQGSMGVMMTEDVSLESLVGRHTPKPLKQSPLEKGDILFGERKYTEAEKYYQEQAITAEDKSIKQECRYKQALCLEKMKKIPDTERLLIFLAEEEGTTWPLLAYCWILNQHLLKDRVHEANVVFDTMSLRFTPEELLAHIPEELRLNIIDKYRRSSLGYTSVIAQNYKKNIGLLKKAISIHKYFDMSEQDLIKTQFALFRTYSLAGLQDEALALGQEVIKGVLPRLSLYTGNHALYSLVEEYSWILRLKGRYKKAFETVGRFLYSKGKLRREWDFLLIEKSRIYAAMSEWKKAEDQLNLLMEQYSGDRKGELHYSFYSAVCLIRGFLLSKQGNKKMARDAWMRGYFKDPDKSRNPLDENATYIDKGLKREGKTLFHFGLLASLSTELTDELLEKWYNKAYSAIARSSKTRIKTAVSFLKSSIDVKTTVYPVIRKIVRSPEWYEMARNISFQDIPYPEYVKLIPIRTFSFYITEEAFLPPVSKEQEDFICSLAEKGYQSTLSGEIGKKKAILIGIPGLLLWKGMYDPNSWQRLEPNLIEWMKGPFAYVLGKRFQKLGRSSASEVFFKAALKNAGKDELLKKLVQKELSKTIQDVKEHTEGPVVSSKTFRKLPFIKELRLRETSGIACSRIQAGVFWTHNDSGDKARIYSIDLKGNITGTYEIPGAENKDWEDMASVNGKDGKSYLLVADTGNNSRRKTILKLYYFKEPGKGEQIESKTVMTLSFRYEQGPQNCEAVAIDPETYDIYIISKMFEKSSGLYKLPSPYRWEQLNKSGTQITAEHVMSLNIPVVTAMDISPSGKQAVILSHGGVYRYTRKQGEKWTEAFSRQPVRFAIPNIPQAEAVCFGPDGKSIYITSEIPEGNKGLIPFYVLDAR
ncbi:protein kinase [Planctomycetota bacterium]